MHTREEKLAAFGRLLDIMDALREQCPWNAAQTMDSIRPMTEEEVYELSDTILEGDRQGTAKEIGDLLYHMVFYARIGQEEGAFDIADSMNKVCDKMVFRHPHVFGPEAGKQTSAKEIADTWELVKAKEKGGNKTVMGGIPKAMPAILKALSMQEKARGCGFDWEQKEDVWPKVQEEMGEAKDACEEDDPKHMQEEFGDLLFAVVNVCRDLLGHLVVDNVRSLVGSGVRHKLPDFVGGVRKDRSDHSCHCVEDKVHSCLSGSSARRISLLCIQSVLENVKIEV